VQRTKFGNLESVAESPIAAEAALSMAVTNPFKPRMSLSQIRGGTRMTIALTASCIAVLFVAVLTKRARDRRDLATHNLMAEAMYALLTQIAMYSS